MALIRNFICWITDFLEIALVVYISLLGLHNKVPRTRWLTQRRWLSHSCRSWKSKTPVSVGWVPCKGCEGDCVLWLFLGQVACRQPSIPWLVEASHPDFCFHVHRTFFSCVCVQISFHDKDTSHVGLETHLCWYDLILTDYISNNPISK